MELISDCLGLDYISSDMENKYERSSLYSEYRADICNTRNA